MSFRDRLHNIAVGGYLIAACLWPRDLTAQETRQQQETPQQQEPGARTDPAPPTQIIVPDASALRSVFDDWVKRSDAEKAANEASEQRKERRAEAELAARQETARWAFWVFAVLAGQMILSILTVWLLWRTFRQTRSAAADARAVFARSDRPYVLPENLGHLHRVMAAHDITGGVSFRIGNYGKVPAVVNVVEVKFAVVQMPLSPKKLAAPNAGRGKDVVASFALSKTLPPGEVHDLEVIAMPPEMKAPLQFEGSVARMQPGSQVELFVVVRIEYEDAANGPLRRAQTVWRLGPEGFARHGGKRYNHETDVAEAAGE